MEQGAQSLIIRFPNWVGDIVMGTVVLQAVERSGCFREVGAVGPEAAEILLKGSPALSRFIRFDRHEKGGIADKWVRAIKQVREGRFDWGVLLAPSFSSAFFLRLSGVRRLVGYPTDGRRMLLDVSPPLDKGEHLVDQFIKLLSTLGSFDASGLLPRLWLSQAERDRGREELGRMGLLGGERFLAVFPGATYGPSKRWYPKRFAEVMKEIGKRHGVRSVVFGSVAERELAEEVSREAAPYALAAAGKLGLRETAAAVSWSEAALGNDSGGVHLAAALKRPVVALFGSSSPAWTAPPAPNSKVVWKGLDCSPCFDRECRLGTYSCWDEISVLEVRDAVEEMMAL